MSIKVETKLDKDLHQAAATGSSKLLQKILDTGKVHIDCRDEEGITPLMLATANNRLNCVKILLQEGAEPNIKSKDGTSSIFLAARCGYAHLLSLLTEKLTELDDLSRKDGITPLIMAAAMNHGDCIDVLLSLGTDPNEESKIGSTPLFHACLRGHIKAAKRLICDPRINLRVLKNGETCLHAAAISGHPELVQLLLDAKSDPLLTNSAGQSPLELLIMFINYGNISLTPNLLKVLNLLLPSDSDKIKSCAFNSNGIIPPEEMGKIRKLVRIYCPFNIQHNHESKEIISCTQKEPRKNGQSRSLNVSPFHANGNGRKINNNHVRFTPDLKINRRSSWEPPAIIRCQCKLLTMEQFWQSLKKSPKKVFLSSPACAKKEKNI